MSGPKLERGGLSDASLEELLSGVSPALGKPPSAIGMWLEQEAYYPGTSRIQAAELYARYVDWRAQHPEFEGKVEPIRVWGRDMASRFRTTRGKSGVFYWISRQREP